MKNARTRKLLAMLAISIPVFLVARGVAGDMAGTRATASGPLAGSVIDLWYLWALRHEPMPAGPQVAGNDGSKTKAQQESQP